MTRTQKFSKSHLHLRLIYTFSMFATVPIVVITVLAVFFYFFGIQAWFSERVSTAIGKSQAVAAAYLEEHKQAIRADTLAMANDLNRLDAFYYSTGDELENVLRDQSYVRNLSEAIVFDETGRILARSGMTFSLELEEIPTFALSRAQEGDVVIVTSITDDRVRALIKLDAFDNSYLFAGRMIDPEVLQHLSATTKASQDYQDLRGRYRSFQNTAIFVFVAIGIFLLVSAIWLGLILARQLVAPIKDMIDTVDRVRAGDMRARVTKHGNVREFDFLAESFNRMTKRIAEQRDELIDTNRQLDRRRQFTESVLTGVSAGVIGLDVNNVVTTANISALKLLDLTHDDVVTHAIDKILPQVSHLIDDAHDSNKHATRGEITYTRKDEEQRIFLVRVVIEMLQDEDIGTIITFDDITELQSAQRKAAWADVARRIAHEIKNPLTPIQLSAERLKRKYLKQIKEDPEIFETCTDTIIHHVEGIGRMVTSFSDFAKMPEPRKEQFNVQKLLKETLTLQEQAYGKITFKSYGMGKAPIMMNADPQLIRQAVNNLLQNAIDAVEGQAAPQINTTLKMNAQHGLIIMVEDNGGGFPASQPVRQLLEPYVTQKEKGTGLGLAIVKKIMDDHEGHLILGRPEWMKTRHKALCGACAILVFDNNEIKD